MIRSHFLKNLSIRELALCVKGKTDATYSGSSVLYRSEVPQLMSCNGRLIHENGGRVYSSKLGSRLVLERGLHF
jgi:hypothetical protein